jgi:mono/diheme cytochrome c family protein
MFFFDAKPYKENPDYDKLWNRGAYLVQGPGHCGACHTPRGAAFQEKALDEGTISFLSGATLDGWTAPSLRGESSTGLGRWSEADIVQFLKFGRNKHASVFGSMIDAYNNSTQFLSDNDLAAIARYLKSLPPANRSDQLAYVYNSDTASAFKKGSMAKPGAATYQAHCAGCHGIDGASVNQLLPSLAGNPNVLTDDPSSLINIVLNGAERVVGQGVPDTYSMTGFRLALSDQEISDVTSFVRQAWGNRASAVSPAAVAALRGTTSLNSNRVTVLKMR